MFSHTRPVRAFLLLFLIETMLIIPTALVATSDATEITRTITITRVLIGLLF
jgi:hypothetical protein